VEVTSPDTSRRRLTPTRVSCLVYLAFGMPVAMIGVAWPTLREDLGRSDGDLGILVLAYGLGRLVTSASSGALLGRIRYGVAAALTLVGLALGGVWVATTPSWPWLITAVAVIGVLSGVLDSLGARWLAVSASVSQAGLAAGSYGVGATVGPIVLAVADSVAVGFLSGAAVALVAAAVVVLPSIEWPAALSLHLPRPADVDRGPSARELLARPAVLVSLGLFAAFVSLEVTTGGWLAATLQDARGLSDRMAGLAVGGFWGGITVGRLLLGRFALPERALLVSVGVLLACFGLLAAAPDALAIPLAVVAGVALAPQFPTLLAHTGDRVGVAAAGRVSGWQLLAANIGGTGLAALTGLIVDATGPGAPLAVLEAITVAGGVLLIAAANLRAPRTPRTAA
jgi:fucose permease